MGQRNQNQKKNILIATQGSKGRKYLPKNISYNLPFIVKGAVDSLNKDIAITIKKHRGEKNSFAELKKCGHIKVVDDDLYGHLSVADVLITVSSTTVLETNALNKPYITFGPVMDASFSRKEYHAKNEKELTGIIGKALYDPSFTKKMVEDQRKIFENQCYRFDGKASQRAAEIIQDQGRCPACKSEKICPLPSSTMCIIGDRFFDSKKVPKEILKRHKSIKHICTECCNEW